MCCVWQVVEVTLDKSPSQYQGCDTTKWGNDAIAKIKASGIAVASYDHHAFYHPESMKQTNDCNFGGVGGVGVGDGASNSPRACLVRASRLALHTCACENAT